MRNIVIIGAGDGVGKSVATMLKDESLILVDVEKENVEKLAKNLNQKSFVCDVTNIEQIKKLKNFVINTFSKIHCIINCAGIWTKGELSQLSDEHFASLNDLQRIKKLIDTNIFGIIAIINQFAPILIKQKVGQIININSQSGVEVEEFCPVYNASKHTGYSYRKAIQRDLAKNNVKITDICPGLIKTNFYIRANDKLPDEIMCLGLEPEDVAKTILYVMNLPHEITIPSIEIRNIKNY